jgi:hypothetical protein
MKLNKWQRAWVVVSLLWVLPVLTLTILAVTMGQYRLYSPPKLVPWDLICEKSVIDNVAYWEGEEKKRDGFAQKAANPEKGKRWFSENGKVTLQVWVPESSQPEQACSYFAPVIPIYNPDTKSIQLPVLASLEEGGLVYGRGYDVPAAATPLITQRIENSRTERRTAILIGLGIAVSLPMTLYVLGAAVAWIRRG